MTFDHERLDVYRLALDFLVFANELTSKLPRGRAHFADQLGRAALSVLLNIAEGAGKTSPADKRRFYLTARGSATESAAMLDALARIGLLDEARQVRGKEICCGSYRSGEVGSQSGAGQWLRALTAATARWKRDVRKRENCERVSRSALRSGGIF